MKSSLAGFALCTAALAAVLVPSVAQAADQYAFAVKAPPGLTFMVTVEAGSKGHSTSLAKAMNLSSRDGSGFYVFTVPASFDASKVGRWCATVVNPAKYVENAVCTPWGGAKALSGSRYELTLPKLKTFKFG
jgi:hypothetical protein